MPRIRSAIRFGRFELRVEERVLLDEGRPCRLGGRAFDLLVVLLENADRIVSREEVLEGVWSGLAVEPGNLTVQVWTLRRLLGRFSIITVPRRGYRYVGPAPHRLHDTRRLVAMPPSASADPGSRDDRRLLRWRSRPA